VQLCRYGGLNDSPPLGLQAGKVVTDTGTVGSLASEINGLPPGPAGPVLCPADDGSEIVAAFRYSSGPDDPVGVALTGCEEVGNGHITRTAATSPLIGRLESLVPVPAPRPAKRDATISGYVRLCGGPAPGRCWDGSIGTCTRGGGCVTTDRIAVLDGGGKVVARARLRHGRFRVSVPAGDYVVRLLADGRQVHGRIVQTRRVTVRAGHTATVRFQFDVP